MKTQPCCGSNTRAAEGSRCSASWRRRGREMASWIFPAVTLALLPKCPACVAAYVALATGVTISLPEAGYLRIVLAAACVGSLGFMLARRLQGLMTRLLTQ